MLFEELLLLFGLLSIPLPNFTVDLAINYLYDSYSSYNRF